MQVANQNMQTENIQTDKQAQAQQQPPIQERERERDEGRRKLILFAIIFILLVGLVIGLILIRQPQIFFKEAAPICPADGAVCRWDAQENASYKVKVVDVTTGEVVFQSEEIVGNEVKFTPQVDHKYRCTVTPFNECGEGPSQEAVNTCLAQPQPTPTQPEPTATSEPTQPPSPTGSPTPPTSTPAPTNTPTPSPTNTPTPTPQPTSTPKIVKIIVTATPTQAPPTSTPTASPTPVSVAKGGVEPTKPIPVPETPAAGDFLPGILGVLGGLGILLAALLL